MLFNIFKKRDMNLSKIHALLKNKGWNVTISNNNIAVFERYSNRSISGKLEVYGRMTMKSSGNVISIVDQRGKLMEKVSIKDLNDYKKVVEALNDICNIIS